MYCSKEKMIGSARTSSHSSRCLSKSDWSGDYLGDVIPLSGITVKIESNDKDFDDDNGILTNEVALHDQELEGKCDVDVPDQELEGKDDIYVPAQELEGKCDMAVHDQELEGKCEVALRDQELGGKCDLAVPHQELEGKGDIAVPDQELEGTCDISVPDKKTEGKGDVAVHEQELEGKCDVDVPDEEINGEPGLFIAGIPPTYVQRFYKGPKEINEKNIIRNAFQDGDSFFNFGDLIYMEKDFFVYFQDRVGDTYRWKGENVSTNEVANVLTALDFIHHDANVYGVTIPVATKRVMVFPVQNRLDILGICWGNVDIGNVQQLRFQRFQKMDRNRNSVLVEENVQQLRLSMIKCFQKIESNQNSVLDEEIIPFLQILTGNHFQILESNQNSVLDKENVQQFRFPTGKRFQILESNRNSVLDEETVQQLRLPIEKSVQIQESNQNSVLDSEFSCCFEPMVNVKRHGNNEEYYNFDQEENKNQENIKRTDHDPKEFIGKSTEHAKPTNCSMFTTRLLMIIMMLPTFVMSESTIEKRHEQYLWHSDGRFSDQIVIPSKAAVTFPKNKTIRLHSGCYPNLTFYMIIQNRVVANQTATKKDNRLYEIDMIFNGTLKNGKQFLVVARQGNKNFTVYNSTDDQITKNENVDHNWTWPEFEEDEAESLHMEERSEQRDTNSESCTRKSSVYVELAPILKPHCFINLSELKALSQNVTLQKKAAKQKKTSKDSLSHEQTSTMFKVMIVCVLVVVAYLIIMERLSLVLSSTFKTSVPAALCLVVLSSYQMYYVVSIVIARMEIVRKKQIYDGNDGAHLLTDYESLYVIAYFCGSLVPGLWIYNEYTKKLNPVELLILWTTFCLSMMVVAWTAYLLHHIVLEYLNGILLAASYVLVEIVAVVVHFVSVLSGFTVSLLCIVYKRLSKTVCIILLMFVTLLERVAKIEMFVFSRIMEKLHSSIISLQIDLPKECLMFKKFLNDNIVQRKPMNSDDMQDGMIGQETAQCCKRIRSCGKDDFCEIETGKVKLFQETTEGHKFIESVSEIDHGKELKDHSLNFDCEVCDTMERSETEIDEIKYERSTTNDVYSSEMIILTDLLHSTPVDGDHEFFDAMERSETEIDEINYERSTANNVYSNETIILKDLLHSTPVERDHEVCVAMEKNETEIDKISYERSTTDDMYSNETIILKHLSHSTLAERNHLSTKKSIHEETNVKRLVCNDTTCSLDEDNLMRVELEDSEDLSVDEFNITQDDDLNDDALQGSHGYLCSEDNDIADQNVFDYIRSIEIEEDGEPFCRNTKLEDDDEPFSRNTKSTSIDRYSNRVWSLPDYHMIPELNKDYQVIPELNKGDISNTSMKSDSEFASNSLKNGSDNGSLSSSCSCNVDAHVFNCQFDSPHSFVNESNNAMQSSRTVIDLQKRQESKSHARIVDSKKKPLLKEMINEKVSTTENVRTIVRNTIETIKQKSISNLAKKSCKKCFMSYRKKPRRRLTRRRLRRLIYPHGNISHVHVDIEARPHLNALQRNSTTNGSANGLHDVGAAALATSRQSLKTSLPSSSNSLNNYFSKLLNGYEFSTDEKMQFELLRVQSFQDLPASCSISPIRLARTGFFSSGSGDVVTCFSCGVKYKGWQKNDNPTDVHCRISSDCRMVNGRETRNIPVSQQHNGIIEHSGQQESFAHTTNGSAQSTLYVDGDVSTQTTEATQNREMTMEEVTKSNCPDNIQQSTNIKPPVDQPYSRQPPLDRANPDQQYARQPATEGASSVLDQNRPAQRDMAEDLGINLDKPKYPAYAQLNVRISTFQGWPGYLDQTPRDMALAGFFYAGYNDYCRCFFCGGGLRNWDSGDDPWVEHTRWFPKCAFVQQNRGRRFVEIIVKRQAEMQASGNSVGNTRNQRAIKTQIGTGDRSETSSQTSSQSAESNSTIDPAKASVRELGYADEIIDRAITIIRQNNPSKQKIEATDIMEVIFTITEDSETNTAVASENTPSSELNLPNTSQAVPQSNVSSQSNQPMSHSSQSNKPLVSKPNPPTAVASQSTNASENSLPSLSVSSLEHGNAAAVKSAGKEISENEIRSLQEENIQLKEQVMCKICMDKNVSIAFLPCGHLACCIDCAPAMRKCPMCRVYIKGTVKTFLA